jgi:hypothetical protein
VADLTPSPGDSRSSDRAQLLLAGAFVLAAALIGLTLVLTASNYTATLASGDNAVASGSDAVTIRDAVETDLGRYLDRVNEKYGANPLRRTEFTSVLRDFRGHVQGAHARHGQLVNVSLAPGTAFVAGKRVSQSTAGQFDDPTDSTDGDWALTGTVSSSSLVRNATLVLTDVTASASDEFRLVLSEGGAGDRWEVTVHEDTGGTTEWVLGSTSSGRECRRPASNAPLTVDFTAATFGGEHCPALEPPAGLDSEVVVRFENGNGVRGKYWFVFDPTGSFTSPAATEDVLYAANVAFVYQSATVSYAETLRIAPEELT